MILARVVKALSRIYRCLCGLRGASSPADAPRRVSDRPIGYEPVEGHRGERPPATGDDAARRELGRQGPVGAPWSQPTHQDERPLLDIGDLVSRLRELGWEDVAELVIRRKLSPADRLFRRLDEFVADELTAQHPTSREDPDSIALRSGIPSLPGNPGSPVEGSRTRWSSLPRPR